MRNMNTKVTIEFTMNQLITITALLEATLENIAPEDESQRDSRTRLYSILSTCKKTFSDMLLNDLWKGPEDEA